ncbi:MAG: sensor histidine kinase [Eubacteriales bacterium]|nr:sensor histidine kinase [Eubacteriales bacterium]
MASGGKRGRFSFLSEKFSSIRMEILLPFSILMLTAIAAMALISTVYTKEAVYDNARNYTGRLLSQLNKDIDSYISYMENISVMIRDSEDVQTWLFGEDEEKREQAGSAISAQMETVLRSRPDIYNIGIIADSGKSLINGRTDLLNQNVQLSEVSWYREALEEEDGFQISSSHVQNMIRDGYQWVITLSTAVRNRNDLQQKAVVFIDLNYSSISDLCENNRLESQEYVFILDADRRIIYHPRQQLLYGGLRTEHTSDLTLDPEGEELAGDDGKTLLYISRSSEKTGWTVVSAAVTKEMLGKSSQAGIIYLLAAVVLIVVGVTVSNAISKRITQPMQTLGTAMERMQSGDLQRHPVTVEGSREITLLSDSFNQMSERIDSLVQQNQREQEEKRKMQLRALQSQINPHFLYNTLDSIIWMAESGKNEEVVKMTAALARLLRQNISNEEEEAAIEQEILAAQSYLTIQKMRYQDKLEYEINIASDIKQERILKMVLQPIIENAIYHGLKYKESRGFLNINGYRIADEVIIEIQDNGVGMDEETLAHIFEEHKVNYHSNGVGVYNVQKRLQLTYGAEYGLVYESRKNVGTCVTVRIPVVRSEQIRKELSEEEGA